MREQLQARQTLHLYTHQVKVPSSQHLEQPIGCRGQLTIAERLQRQIEIPATRTSE